MIKSGWLVILSILLGLVFLFILYVVWINRGTDKTISIFIKSVGAPILIACVLLIYELASPLPIETEKILVFVPRGQRECSLISEFLQDNESMHSKVFSESKDIYFDRNVLKKEVYPTLNQEEKDTFENIIFLDRIELVFIKWLNENYCGHWDVQAEEYIGISSKGVSSGPKKDAEKFTLKITNDKILELFQNNIIIRSNPKNIDDLKFSLPLGSTIKTTREPTNHCIIIETRGIKLKITINKGGFETMGGGKLAYKLMQKINLEGMQADLFEFEFETETKVLTRWSPETLKQLEWKNQLLSNFKRDFDWSLIRQDIDKFL